MEEEVAAAAAAEDAAYVGPDLSAYMEDDGAPSGGVLARVVLGGFASNFGYIPSPAYRYLPLFQILESIFVF